MKLGTENRKMVIAAAVLVPLALLLLVRSFAGAPAPAPAPAISTPTAQPTPRRAVVQAARARGGTHRVNAPSGALKETLDPAIRFDLLKNSEARTYEGSGRNIFVMREEQPVLRQVAKNPEPVKQPEPVQPAPYTPPPPPPINLKFYGYANKPGEPKRVFFSQGEDIFVGAEGEVIARRYRIVRIGPNSVEVEDILNNNRQTLPLQQG
jgi:hypothetical protein